MTNLLMSVLRCNKNDELLEQIIAKNKQKMLSVVLLTSNHRSYRGRDRGITFGQEFEAGPSHITRTHLEKQKHRQNF